MCFMIIFQLRIIAQQQREDLRAEFRATIADIPPEQLIFVDETGFVCFNSYQF